ncbi:heavy-metal-associated domain-containing protein [Urechidicola croceus]|uniref:Heavy metal transporter n=1 Tax=Urechidicola croceus TaxID=1850246 RepID=A0A1D8P6D9_9FLAO|nr:heavy metal-associated domain-containing protein [Urechidicola croceus]AOW20128.1 heavy metal transporter [Urechidicola croceus]
MRAHIKVQNLKCGGCEKTIITKLSPHNNISDVLVDIETSIVSFEVKNQDDVILAKEKLRFLGYPTVDDQNTVISKVKSIVSCATGKITS